MRKIILPLLCLFFLVQSVYAHQSIRVSKNEISNVNTYTFGEDKPTKPMSVKELKKHAAEVKGDKLTFKEKLAIQLFGKKVQTISKHQPAGGEKSQTVAFLLCWFLGGLGIHRFYLGYTGAGIIQLLTGGGCGIWWLIDFIRIITGDLKPKGGEYDKAW